tara:strand:- start:449 stop:1354 length:906 start_codon:yes stop_codon:yes gene_type:complete
MAKIEFKCPKCKKSNKIVIMGNDSGKFTKTCVKCTSEVEVEIDSELKVQASLLEDKIQAKTEYTEVRNMIPEDYKKYDGESLIGVSNRKAMVNIVSMLILAASLAGVLNGFYFLNLPDEYPDYESINIEIVVKNNTADIDDALIVVNSDFINQTYIGNGTYNILLKPGRYMLEVSASGHKNSMMEIYVPVQDNNLKLIEIDQGIQGINRFVFDMEEGEGETKLEDSVYVKIARWCSGITFVFSAVGIWGAWVTYKLQSYKNAQIGAFFSIIAMGLLIVGPILGFVALILLTKIKNEFNRSL